jgi:hypothetical protein
MPSSDAKPLAMNLLQRVMSNLIVALRPSVNMHIKEILQMLRRYNYSSLQVIRLIHDGLPMTMLLLGHDAHKACQNEAVSRRSCRQSFQLRHRHRKFFTEALGVRARCQYATSFC